MKHFLLMFCLVLTLLSCKRAGKAIIPTNNDNFEVELLFEADGCKVYRFKDLGEYKYFSTCQGSVEWSVQEGGSDDSSPTVVRKSISTNVVNK